MSKILDNIGTADFWRGLIYVLTSAGLTISPINSDKIIAGGVGLSGLIHLLFPGKKA